MKRVIFSMVLLGALAIGGVGIAQAAQNGAVRTGSCGAPPTQCGLGGCAGNSG